jgi:hypothetical protein
MYIVTTTCSKASAVRILSCHLRIYVGTQKNKKFLAKLIVLCAVGLGWKQTLTFVILRFL